VALADYRLRAVPAGEPRRALAHRLPGPRRPQLRKHTLYFLDGDRTDSKPVRTKPLTVDPPRPKDASIEAAELNSASIAKTRRPDSRAAHAGLRRGRPARMMLRDALLDINGRTILLVPPLCGEGVCGSDAVNVMAATAGLHRGAAGAEGADRRCGRCPAGPWCATSSWT